jgi:hypothetical protein
MLATLFEGIWGEVSGQPYDGPPVASGLTAPPAAPPQGAPRVGCLGMPRPYNAVFVVVTPKATRVIDRFHVMRHAILAVDQTRRRVQQQHLGHRGRAADPLSRARKLLVIKATAGDAELTPREPARPR